MPHVRRNVYLGRGDGGLRASIAFEVGASPVQAAAADFDGDGRLDLATVNSAESYVSVVTGGALSAAHETLPGPVPRTLSGRRSGRAGQTTGPLGEHDPGIAAAPPRESVPTLPAPLRQRSVSAESLRASVANGS